MSAARDIDARLNVQKLRELPPVSGMAVRLLALLDDPDVEVRRLARAIEQDPPLTARIVGLSNSAYYGVRQPVTSVEEAIFSVLGIATTKSLALGIMLSAPFETRRVNGFRPEQYWFTSLATALLAQQLAPQVGVDPAPKPDDAYLCGLLHGIGQLVLMHLYPRQMALVLAHPERSGSDSATLEREVLGVDYLQAGGWLARRWQLPESVVVSIERHREPDYAGAHWIQARLVTVCLSLCGESGAGEERLAGDMAKLRLDPLTARRAAEAIADEREAMLAMAGLLAS